MANWNASWRGAASALLAICGLPIAAHALGNRAAPADVTVTEALGRGRPLVVIDAGHGGRDPGATSPSTGIHEKDINLLLARAIRDALVREGRVRVAMTRDDDRFIALAARVAVARRLRANLFIAVHSDSAPNPLAHGATIYTLSEVASDLEAARLAVRENSRDDFESVDLGASDPGVRAILADLTRRETMAVSADFASLLQREASATGVTFRNQYHRFANFRVLRAADTAAILLESGYLTNSGDTEFLASPEGRARIAAGMARSIGTHFARQRALQAQLPAAGPIG